MLNRHPVIKRALALVLSFALVLPTAFVGQNGTSASAVNTGTAATSLAYIQELKSNGGAFNILEIAPQNAGNIGYYIAGFEPCQDFGSQAEAFAESKIAAGGSTTTKQTLRVAQANALFQGIAAAKIVTSSGADAAPLSFNGSYSLNSYYQEIYPWQLTADNKAAYPQALTLGNTTTAYDTVTDHVAATLLDKKTVTADTDLTPYAYNKAAATYTYVADGSGKYNQNPWYFISNQAEIDNLRSFDGAVYFYSLHFDKLTVDTATGLATKSDGSALGNTGDVVSLYVSTSDAAEPSQDSFSYYEDYTVGSTSLDSSRSYYIITAVSAPLPEGSTDDEKAARAAKQETNASHYIYAAVTKSVEPYVAATGNAKGYFNSNDANVYTYVGDGQGSYKLTPDSSAAAVTIKTNKVYHNVCYTNNNWFKKYVFDCSDAELQNFTVTVTSRTPDQVTASDLTAASLISLSYGMALSEDGKNSLTGNSTFSTDLSDSVLENAETAIIRDDSEKITPLILDSRLQTSDRTNIKALANYSNFGVSNSTRVKTDVYLFTPDTGNPPRANFATGNFRETFTDTSPYAEVAAEIATINNQRKAQGSSDLLDPGVSMATIVRHIINISKQTVTKGEYRVLDIEPGNSYHADYKTTLSQDTAKSWFQTDNSGTAVVYITTWSTPELIGRIDELGEEFDAVYLGTSISGYAKMQLDGQGGRASNLNQWITDYNDSKMDGLVYTNIGDSVRAGGGDGYSLGGLLSSDYNSGKTLINANASTTTADQFRLSGNDLTDNTVTALKNYASAGHPIVVADDVYNQVTQAATITNGTWGPRVIYNRDVYWDPLTKWNIRHHEGDIFLDLSQHYYYDMQATKTALAVDPFNPTLLARIIKYVSDKTAQDVEDEIANFFKNPSYSWEESADGGSTWTAISSERGINIATFADNTLFRCKVTIKLFNLDLGKFDDFKLRYLTLTNTTIPATTQTAKLTKSGPNPARIDVNSKMYTLLDAIKNKNVFSESAFSNDTNIAGTAAASTRSLFHDLVDLTNPKIVFETTVNATSKVDCKPVAYTGIDGASIAQDSSGKCYLDYKFRITNNTDALRNATKYACYLYIDENSDGRYTADEKLDFDITDATTGDIVSNTALLASPAESTDAGSTADTESIHIYTIRRPLPDTFCGILPWKLQVVQLKGDGTESGIKASQTGYTHVSHTAQRPQKSLKILQILPKYYTVDLKYTHGAADNSQDLSSYFDALYNNGDYQVQIDVLDILDANGMTQNKLYEKMLGYDMLIVGFGDAFGTYKQAAEYDMTASTANAIKQYAEYVDDAGNHKAVLFSHDCASFYYLNSSDFKDTNNYYVYTDDTVDKDLFGWIDRLFNLKSYYYGYNFNTILRDTIGVDRYAVTANGQTSKAAAASNYSTAYQPSTSTTDKGATLPLIQGLTNNLLMRYYKSGGMAYGYLPTDENASQASQDIEKWFKDLISSINANSKIGKNSETTTTVTQLNKGQITSYPYNVNTAAFQTTGNYQAYNSTATNQMPVAETHLQYQQLNMNPQDIVVWYCLAGGTASNSLYSTAYYQTYNLMTNDAVNQYYIYTRGNITYTGTGHSKLSGDEEKQLLVNTIIASARQTDSAPIVSFTDENGGKTNITKILVPAAVPSMKDGGSEIITTTQTTANTGDENRRIYFRLQSTSLNSSNKGKTKTYGMTFNVTIGDTIFTYDTGKLPVYYINNGTVKQLEPSTDGKYYYDPGQIYFVKLDSLLSTSVGSTTVKSALSENAPKTVTFSITPVLNVGAKAYQGQPNSITIGRMQLFDLG